MQLAVLPLRRNDLSVCAAGQADRPDVRRLLETNWRVHLHLDWWTLDEWIGNPACVAVRDGRRIVGLGLGARDTAEAAWLRAVAVADGLALNVLLDVLLPAVLDALRAQGVQQLVCMAWADWLAGKLPQHGFEVLTRVVTLHKRDGALSLLGAPNDIDVRPAAASDLDCIRALDHAAFQVEWWYSGTALWRAMKDAARFMVAEQAGQIVGYAFGSWMGALAHITRVAVQPAYQRQGIGARLTVDLIRHFREQGAEVITLNTQMDNVASLKLYRRLGFKPAGEAVAVYRHPL